MCGIAGLFVHGGSGGGSPARLAAAMTATLAHRGPDGDGLWQDEQAGIWLGHRRLAIQDLSEAGAQPMASACGRYVISYNGEVYNGAELRAELSPRGHVFRGHSDTEAMLAAIAEWGLDAALARFVGMFAFALWDREARELTLVRDRLGIKPLFWTIDGGRLLFGSEIKAVLAGMSAAPPPCPQGLAAYLRRGHIGAPHTIYHGIHRLAPGGVLRLRRGGAPDQRTYWSLTDAIAEAARAPRIDDPAEARALIEARLTEAVRMRLVSDVPVGALLSGGIDSTLVTALMCETADGPVHSYSIGSPDRSYDEGRHARAIASHLGTRHTELVADEAACRAIVPSLTGVYDEPFGDSSALPTLMLSRLAREHVTVALSGDGADEVFAGYNRYRWNARLAGLRRALPLPLRRLAASALRALPPRLADALGARLAREAGAARRLHKLAAMLGEDDLGARYDAVTGLWPELAGAAAPGRLAVAELGEEEAMQVLDLMGYLPDDILAKVDRASMAHALEVRVPLLDHRVVAAAFRLAPELKLKDGTTKRILREMLHDRVPRALVERPKQGFAVPVGAWLRGALRHWAEGLIRETGWRDLGIDPAPVHAAWDRHAAGRSDETDRLWAMLMLAAWWEVR